jgi:hypothetical protein
MSIGADPVDYTSRYPNTPDPLPKFKGKRYMRPDQIQERLSLNMANTAGALRKRILAELTKQGMGAS